MNMVEVDPNLFIKCRLCLDETGQYQIVPSVQMQIKYCFDIEVKTFDGLPQLVCKKCESILSQYAGIKQIFQEKQKNIKSKLSLNVKIDNSTINQQQQDTVSSTQVEIENKNKVEERSSTRNKSNTPVPTRLSSTESVKSNFIQKKSRKTVLGKRNKNVWESSYTKYFVCRFCAKKFKDRNGIYSHIDKKCNLYKKYSKMNKQFCLVALNKIGSKPNLTGSLKNVVCDENKIIQSKKATYYILYFNNLNNQYGSSVSSDEDFVLVKQKCKKQRIISRSSSDSVEIDQNSEKNSENVAEGRKPENHNDTQIISDIECVDLEDSDSNSTKSSVKTKNLETLNREQTKTINDKMINNIILMCSNKYVNRFNASEAGNPNKDREESSLKHKILSIGRKVIHSKGINTTGLLRYMEHKNLEVVWIPKVDTKVTIKTRSRESGDSDKSNYGWEKIETISNLSYVAEDFACVFEKISELVCKNKTIEENRVTQYNPQCQKNLNEKALDKRASICRSEKEHEIQLKNGNSSNNDLTLREMPTVDTEKKENDKNIYLRTVLDTDKYWTKLLNANPVANPKQLPKKNFNEPSLNSKIYLNENNDSELVEHSNTEKSNEILHMPIITSTVSLAPPVNLETQANVAHDNQNANESNSAQQPMLPKIKVKPVSELLSNEALSQQTTSSFVSTIVWPLNNENQQQKVVLQTNDNNFVYLSNQPITQVVPVQHEVVYYPRSREFVRMHTVELPNTRTESPFRYFQKLLQFHNIILLDSLQSITSSMKCLTRFKVVFEQQSISPVKLNLVLFTDSNIFCIKATDHLLEELDVAKFSANWQWEILKVFKGDDVVPKLIANASRLGSVTSEYSSYFTNLLRSIVYTK